MTADVLTDHAVRLALTLPVVSLRASVFED